MWIFQKNEVKSAPFIHLNPFQENLEPPPSVWSWFILAIYLFIYTIFKKGDTIS